MFGKAQAGSIALPKFDELQWPSWQPTRDFIYPDIFENKSGKAEKT